MRKGIPALLLTLSLLLCGCRLLPERIPPAGLTVHFIDVGQADCALLESGGEYMLIDGGNRRMASWSFRIWNSRAWRSWPPWSAPTPTKTTWAVCPRFWRCIPPTPRTPPQGPMLPRCSTISSITPTSSGWRSPFPPPGTAGRWERPPSRFSAPCSPTPTRTIPPSS